jgi:O-antigen/teichoic acid export membrane protein
VIAARTPESGPREGARVPHLGISVLWTLSGYAVYMACQWAMLVVVARLGSPEKVGEFALGLAVSAPVVLFTNLGLRRIQVTDASGGFLFGDYFGLRLLMSLVAMAVIAGVAFASGYPQGVVTVILAMGLAKAVEAASDVVYGAMQQGERMDLIAGSLLLRGVTGLAGLAGGMAATGSVAWGVLNLALGWSAVFLFYDLPRASRVLAMRGAAGGLRPRWSPRALGRLAWFALPLGIVTTLMSLMASIPTIFIEHLRGAAELGVYTALAYSFAASHRVATAMGEAASARLARHHAEGRRREFLRVLGGLLLLAGLVGAAGLTVAVLAGRPLLGALYGPEYAQRSDLFVGFMLVAVAADLGIVLDYTMTAMRRLKIQPVLYGGAIVAYTALCGVLIPSRGLGGAVLALGIVSLVQGAVTLAVVARALASFPRATAAQAGAA